MKTQERLRTSVSKAGNKFVCLPNKNIFLRPWKVLVTEIAQSVQRQATGWKTKGFRAGIPAGLRISSSPAWFKRALGRTQPSIKLVPRARSPSVRSPGLIS
jgi:hypothetical protein